jgi:hypothetical protein
VRAPRAAALAVLALAAAGCSSSSAPQRAAPLPVSGPPNVIRIALADLLWPLEPERAKTRDQIVVARMLFSTPLRTDASGALRPGLCTRWRAEGPTWRLHCSHPGAIAAQLRRTQLVPSARISVPAERTLVLRFRVRDPDLPYRLTQVAAAPPGVPGPFRLISASRRRVVVERKGTRVEIQRLEPFAALKLFRAGKLDEAPVPLGDIRATRLDPQLAPVLRVRKLLGVDVVAFLPREVDPEVVRVYDDTADRADYQALVTEFEAPPAEDLRHRGQPSAAKAAIALREARKRIPSLPKVAIPFSRPTDPTLVYGTNLLVAGWRDLGLDPYVVANRGLAHAGLARLIAPYPKRAALRSDFDVVPIAWVADARLVSPRLRGWREDELGSVDYSKVTFQAPSRRR